MVSWSALARATRPLGAICLVVVALGGCASAASVHATVTPTTTTVPPTPTLSALATATSVPPPPTPIAARWTSYQDAQYFFSLQAPMSGHFISTDNGYYSVMFQLGSANGDSATLWVGIAELTNSMTTLEQQFCSSATTTTVAGFPAVVADNGPPAGTASAESTLARLFVARGLFYVVQLMSPQTLDQLRQRLGPLYAQILATFQPGPGKPGNVICAS
jgi:hypothetical protein